MQIVGMSPCHCSQEIIYVAIVSLLTGPAATNDDLQNHSIDSS